MKKLLVLVLLVTSTSALAQAPSAPSKPKTQHKFLWFGHKTQAPGAPSSNVSASPRAVTHTVTVTFQNLTCNSVKGTCTGQIYRANANCPAGGGITGPTWTQIIGNLAAATVTSASSSYSYVDNGVANGQTYCYYATNQYTAGTDGPSGPSNTFQVQTPAPPDNPVNLTGTVN